METRVSPEKSGYIVVEGGGSLMREAVRRQMEFPSLTPDRERELLRSVRDGGTERERHGALTELWQSYSKLVVAIARRYRTAGIELTDLIGAGHLGLHAAINRFDPDKFDCRLSSYAVGWIRWYIQDYIKRNAAPVRMPESNAHRQLTQQRGCLLAEARRNCEREYVEPSLSELYTRIAYRVGLPLDEVARSMGLLHGHAVSLDNNVQWMEGSSVSSRFAEPESTSPEDDVILRLDHAKARIRIRKLAAEILGERERVVFLSRCMNENDEVAHLDSLARRFGISRERVYQLEASAKRKIGLALSREGYTSECSFPSTRASRRSVKHLESEPSSLKMAASA
jgi:RNA polymerase sigma-32 factor